MPTKSNKDPRAITQGLKNIGGLLGFGAKKPVPKPTVATSSIKSPGTSISYTTGAKTTTKAADEAAKRSLFQTLLGSKGNIAKTVIGGALLAPPAGAVLGAGSGLYSRYADLFSGGGTPEYDPTKIMSPMDIYNQQQQMLQDYYAGKAPDLQADMDRLARFTGAMGQVSGGGAGAAGGNAGVYGQQARAALDSAAAGTGTATSGLTPVAGTVAAQTDAMRGKGQSLQDYLAVANRAANAAGLAQGSAARERLSLLAYNQYNKRQNAVQEKLDELQLARVQNLPNLINLQSQSMIDEPLVMAAEAARKQGGNKYPIETYINNLLLAKWNQSQSQGG